MADLASGARDTADVTVVIPAWNERENLDRLLPALREVLDHLGLRAQVVVADGGSTDRTAETAARWGAQVVRQREPGYGGALLAGFAVAVAPYVVTMDADLSHRPLFLEAFWRHRHDAEILIASRYVPGGGGCGPARAERRPEPDLRACALHTLPGPVERLSHVSPRGPRRPPDRLPELRRAAGDPDPGRRRRLAYPRDPVPLHSRILPGGYAHEHITRFTRRALAERLTGLGFEVLDCRYVGGCEMIFKARKR